MRGTMKSNNRQSQGSKRQQVTNNSNHSRWLANPARTLVAAFAAWKLFLLAITIGSCLVNSEAYDTSGGLVILDHHRTNDLKGRIVARLTSWDAIYFISTARRGYRFEQEWAFGSALPVVIRGFLTSLGLSDPDADFDGASRVPEALVGILLANLAHLLSVISLYHLGRLIWQPLSRNPSGNHPHVRTTTQTVTLVAALLHVITPGGIFLVAPYAESSCSFLTFAGYALYARSCLSTSRGIVNGYLILAGLSFGIATWFRSNAILNGIPFAWEVLSLLPRLVWPAAPSTSSTWSTTSSLQSRGHVILRLASLGIGGVLVAMGSIGPQAVAYYRFCILGVDAGAAPSGGGDGGLLPRPPPPSWCQGYLPSIFTYVQQHYWNVGFLRYWVPGNIPLFLLAAPMLAILVKSGLDELLAPSPPSNPAGDGSRQGPSADDKGGVESARQRLSTLVRSAAAAQVILAVLAMSTYHVQIITRISSGYPLWYWWLADQLVSGGEKKGSRLGRGVVMFMVMYASIQAALFTSFLPPA